MFIRISCVALSLLASYQATSSQDQLTPKQIADKIEDVAARYQSIQYSTISNKTRVANPFKQQKDPKLITGNGRTSYKRLGDKWVVDVQSFTVSMPSGQKSRIHTGGGFDGAVHWHRDSNSVTIGEEFSGASLHDPTELLWHGARTRGWLLTALRDKSAKVVGKEEIEGHECLRIESAFRDYRFRFSIAPTAGFLPIRSEVAFKGKVQGVEKLSQLRQSNEGLWYPRRIRIEHPDRPIPFVIQRISLRGFESSKESSDDGFQVPRPVGENIVDRRSGIVFHNDPWWPDLEKKLQTDFDWPVPRPEFTARVVQLRRGIRRQARATCRSGGVDSW